MPSSSKIFHSHKFQPVLLFFVFLLFSLWFTQSPVRQLNIMVPQGGDPFLVAWLWSWEMHQIPITPLSLFDANIFAPFKNTLAFTEHMLGSLLLAWPLFLIFKNIILVFNLISLLSFAIAGLGMYLLACYLTKNKAASLVAAFIYAFAPYKINHLEHLNLTGLWLPYFFLFLHKISRDFSWKNTLCFILFSLLVFLNAMQYFLFLPLAVLSFIAVKLRLRRAGFTKEMLIKVLFIICVLLLVAIPIAIPYLSLKNDFNFERSITVIEGLSPDLFDYFISPFFYKLFYTIFSQEWAVGTGLVVLLLLVFAARVLYRHPPQDKTKLVYCFIGLAAVLFSCGYYIQLTRADSGGLIGPWALLYNFIPGFSGIRAVGRYSIFFLLSASVVIALGLRTFFVNHLKNNKKKILVVSFFVLLFLFIEFSFAQPKRYVPVIGHPRVYDWVKAQKNANIYLEMPLGLNYLENNWDASYEYFSIFHFKKIVNGYSGYAPKAYEELNKRLRHFDFQDDDIMIIKQYGATHLIFHFDYYMSTFKDKTINRLKDSELVKLIYQIDNDYVFEIQ